MVIIICVKGEIVIAPDKRFVCLFELEFTTQSTLLRSCRAGQFTLSHFSPLRGNKYSRLSLSRIPRDSLKYFEISVPRHIRFAEFRKKYSINHI